MKKYLLLFLVQFFSACNGGNSDEETSEVEANELIGSWISECLVNPEENLNSIIEYEFKQDSVIQKVTKFLDQSCTELDLSFENPTSSDGVYIPLREIITDSGESVTLYQFIFSFSEHTDNTVSEFGLYLEDSTLYFVHGNEETGYHIGFPYPYRKI